MTYEEIKVLVDSYNESVNLYEESLKGDIGRAGVSTIKTVRDTKDKITNTNAYKSGKQALEDFKNTPSVSKVAGAVSKPISFVGGTLPANAVIAGKNTIAKQKYKDDPEKLEKEIKNNMKQFSKLKSNFLAISVWTLALPIAIKTCFTGDDLFKGIIAAGALATGDKELTSACIKAAAWKVTAVAVLAKLIAKFKKCKSQEEYDECVKEFKPFGEKLEDILLEWAESDQPLFITTKKGPELKNSEFKSGDNSKAKEFKNKVSKAKNNGRNIEVLREAVECYMNDTLSTEEFLFITESMGFDYDNEY